MKQISMNKYKSVTNDSMDAFLNGCIKLNVFIYNLNQNPNINELGIHFVSSKELYSCFLYKCITNDNVNSDAKNMNVKNRKHIVFSGFRSKDIYQQLIQKGHIIEDNITKNTQILVVQDKTKLTSKVKKALKMNIKIMNVQELIESL